MTQTRRLLCVLALPLLGGLARAQGYAFTVYDTLGGTHSNAFGINNLGQVVGTASVTGDTAMHPALWSGVSTSDIGTLGGTTGQAYAINDLGQIAGASHTFFGAWHATYWDGALRVDLGIVDNQGGTFSTSRANGIDAFGRVVGSGQTADFYQHATLWKKPDEMKDVGKSGALVDSDAAAINAAGQIVGWSNVNELATPRIATMWSGATYTKTVLGTLGGANSYASDVNEAGVIVGSAQPAGSSNYHAALWNGAAPAIDLGTLGSGSSYANAINLGGTVVGRSLKSGATVTRATVWTSGTAVDLNTYLDPASAAAGWVLVGASDINDHGTIVGTATNTLTGVTRGFRFEPSVATGGAFVDLGFGAAGFGGVPRLAGAGSLVAGTPTQIELTFAAPFAPALLMLSSTSTPTPFLDGTLIAFPYTSSVFVTTDATGHILLQKPWPAGITAGASIYFQFLVGDAANPFGIAQSNALRADQP